MLFDPSAHILDLEKQRAIKVKIPILKVTKNAAKICSLDRQSVSNLPRERPLSFSSSNPNSC